MLLLEKVDHSYIDVICYVYLFISIDSLPYIYVIFNVLHHIRGVYHEKIILFISLLCLISAAAFAGGQSEAADTIMIATDATWPPMEYIDENSDLVGFDVDLINAIAEEVGLTIELKNTAWDGIFAGLANGAYDAIISSVTITEERKAIMSFTEPMSMRDRSF